jgi:hypothetical protein
MDLTIHSFNLISIDYELYLRAQHISCVAITIKSQYSPSKVSCHARYGSLDPCFPPRRLTISLTHSDAYGIIAMGVAGDLNV